MPPPIMRRKMHHHCCHHQPGQSHALQPDNNNDNNDNSIPPLLPAATTANPIRIILGNKHHCLKQHNHHPLPHWRRLLRRRAMWQIHSNRFLRQAPPPKCHHHHLSLYPPFPKSGSISVPVHPSLAPLQKYHPYHACINRRLASNKLSAMHSPNCCNLGLGLGPFCFYCIKLSFVWPWDRPLRDHHMERIHHHRHPHRRSWVA